MRLLYTFGVRLYALVVRIVSLFSPKAKDWVDGRKNQYDTLPSIEKRVVYWFHCASLGEFDQGLPVMNLIREKEPDVFILVTFFSPSGYNHYHKRKNPVDYACYIPVDTQKNAQKFIRHFHPQKAFFVKYEFWSNHIFELKKTGAKLYSISTLLRPNHRFFKWYGGFFRKTLKAFDFFFAQNQSTVDLLNSIGIKNVILTGDTRFDRVIENKNKLEANPLIQSFVNGSKSVFIAGSTWPQDESLLNDLIQNNTFDKYIIAPHNVDKEHVNNLLKTIECECCLYSKNETYGKVLILDTIGQLASAYS